MVDCLYSAAVNERARHRATPDARPGYVRIGELAKQTGVSPELLRAWEQRHGLLRDSPSALRPALEGAIPRARLVDPPAEPRRDQRQHDGHQIDAALVADDVHVVTLIDKT
jgi:MerR family regulatory protein